MKNFLLERNSVGSKIAKAILIKAQALNPLVQIKADIESVSSKKGEYFAGFTMVVATRLKTDEILRIADVCRTNNVKFICGDVYGMFGYCVSDFQDHDYHE